MLYFISNFPKAILHIDGDAFFASCEITKRPYLRGKPVITGLEKGIASSMTYEAKARGITRAMRISEIKKICPEVVMIPSDFLLYALYSKRMNAIVRRYTDTVEEYSIDECFADITGMDKVHGMTYEELAKRIQNDLKRDLGMTFSVGLSVNKVLAKLASKWQKPNGFTIIPTDKITAFTSITPISKLWGIGGATSFAMSKKGIQFASDFASKTNDWVISNFDKPMREMHAELNGYYINEINNDNNSDHSSLQRTRTFYPPSKDKSFILAQLSQHVENACSRLRYDNAFAGRFSFFIKTQADFRYYGTDFVLVEPSHNPSDFIRLISENIDDFFVEGIEYRATGVRMFNLTRHKQSSLDLFSTNSIDESKEKVLLAVDDMSSRYGSNTIFLGSSARPKASVIKTKKKFNIIFLGEVR
jgi:DNA polymerase-4/DNA polymerase V